MVEVSCVSKTIRSQKTVILIGTAMRIQEVAPKTRNDLQGAFSRIRLFQDAVLTADVAWLCIKLQVVANIG